MKEGDVVLAAVTQEDGVVKHDPPRPLCSTPAPATSSTDYTASPGT